MSINNSSPSMTATYKKNLYDIHRHVFPNYDTKVQMSLLINLKIIRFEYSNKTNTNGNF